MSSGLALDESWPSRDAFPLVNASSDAKYLLVPRCSCYSNNLGGSAGRQVVPFSRVWLAVVPYFEPIVGLPVSQE